MADNYYHSSSSSSSSSQSQPTLPLHLCFFLFVLFAFVTFTWYISFDDIFGPIFDGIKLFFILSPLLLVLGLRLLAFFDSFSGYPPEHGSIHCSGGTPWGVALLLVILFFMVSYQSDLRERWFPLRS